MARTKKEKVYKGTGLYWGLLAVLIMVGTLVILAAQNTDPVTFQFLTWELQYPLVAILLATIGVTVLLNETVGWVWRRRRRRILAEREELRKLRAEKQKVADAEMEAAKADAKAAKAEAKAAKKTPAVPESDSFLVDEPAAPESADANGAQ